MTLDLQIAKLIDRKRTAYSFGKAMTLDHLLAPVDRAKFFEDYWEKRHLHITRDSPDYYNDLLTVKDLDAALCGLALRIGDCRFSRESRVAAGDIAAFPGHGSLRETIDPRKALTLFSEGWTIVFQQAQRWHPLLNQLCTSIFDSLNHNAQCNVYLAPPQSYGFGPHFDTHDVLVLQVHGRKEWKLYSNFIELPLPSQARSLPSQPDDEHCVKLVLQQGEALYIPRGLVHDADSIDGVSAHITLGFLGYTWHDLLSSIMRSIASTNVEFRRSLPPGFINGESQMALKDHVLDLTERFVAEVADSPILDQFCKGEFRLHSVIRQPIGSLSNMVGSYELKLTSVLALNSRSRLAIREVNDETLAIESGGKVVLVPSRIRGAIEFLLGRGKVVISEIPHLDDRSKLILGQRLSQEGVMRVEQL